MVQPIEGGGVLIDVAPSNKGHDAWTIVALVAFVGTAIFCACQAILAPRRTFCSQKMED